MNEKVNLIEPFVGVGNVKFGISREQVRCILGSSYFEFKRNEFSINTTGHYQGLGAFIEYDADGACEAVEFSNNALVVFVNNELFAFKYSELIDYFSGISDNYHEDDFGCTFYDLGIGASKNGEEDSIQTIIAFCKNYWD